MVIPPVQAVALALVALTFGQGQDPQLPVFRGRTATVAVPVTVFDPAGMVVTDLKQEDFSVFDDLNRQEITTFASGLQPIRAVALVDTSASMMSSIDLALLAAEQFVIRLRPEDKAKAGLFSVRTSLSPTFTSDRDALLKWLRQPLPFSNPTKLLDSIDVAITELLAEPGRRVVVVFTDGCDTASSTSWNAILRRIHAEDVMVYAVMFRPTIALRPPEQQMMSFGSPSSDLGARSATRRNPGAPCALDHWLETSNASRTSDFLQIDDPRWIRGPGLVHELASETGGGRLTLSDDDNVNAIFTAMMSELHHFYLLGYTPPKTDGKVHEIRVGVRNKKLVVRARRHYVAAVPAK